MKNLIYAFILVMILPVSNLFAQHYTPIDDGSVVQFKIINHMIFKSTVTGSFGGLKGYVNFDPQNLNASFFEVSVAVNTISTGIGMRDNHLLKDEYFDEAKFPVITIKSKTITKSNINNQYTLLGNLTIKGITKTVDVPFTAEQKNGGYIFKGHFSINRMDFNIGPDNSIDKVLEVNLSVIAK